MFSLPRKWISRITRHWRRPDRKPESFRPRVEALEDRVTPDVGCGCVALVPGQCMRDLVGQAAGLQSVQVSPFSEGPVRYFDGTINLAMTDLASSGFGTPVPLPEMLASLAA